LDLLEELRGEPAIKYDTVVFQTGAQSHLRYLRALGDGAADTELVILLGVM
jgi:hypothetical protein